MTNTVEHWKPVYETMVALRIAGESNRYISNVTGYSETRISQILNTPKAKKRIRDFTSRMRQRMHEEVGDAVIDLAARSIPNLEKTVDADISLADIKAKKHQDDVGLELLGIAGYTKGSQEHKASQAPRLDRDIQERLADAFEKSAEAKALREAPVAETVDEEAGNG